MTAFAARHLLGFWSQRAGHAHGQRGREYTTHGNASDKNAEPTTHSYNSPPHPARCQTADFTLGSCHARRGLQRTGVRVCQAFLGLALPQFSVRAIGTVKSAFTSGRPLSRTITWIFHVPSIEEGLP